MSNFIVNTDIPNLKVVIREGDAYNINIVPGRINTIRTGSFTSYADLAGLAVSASYVSGGGVFAESSSYAITASYAEVAGSGGGFPYSGSAQITGSLEITQNLTVLGDISSSTAESSAFLLNAGAVSIVFTGSINSGIFGISEYVEPAVSTIMYSGTTIEYIAQRTGATRIGMIMATWSGSSVVFTDVSTADIGDTSDISFTFLPSGSYYKLRVNSEGSGSGAWTVQSLFKLFPNLI